MKSVARQISVQRAYWDKWGRAHIDPAKASNITSTAAGIAAVIRHARTLIRPDERIVGYNFGDGAYDGSSWVVPQDAETFREAVRVSGGLCRASHRGGLFCGGICATISA